MDCTLPSSIVLLGGIAFGALAGFITESVLTARVYKPTNHLAVWRARQQSRKTMPVSQPV